ncbi:MAG: hypothetical protein Q8P84_00550 [Deltaproteobacteria bacterium]|nr:hypothetical protein [Deltaproteobacteria bacterium]
MHPDLLNNATFLRYYSQWQENPKSMVFAPIAEYFRLYGMVDEAIKICLEGLKQSPGLVSGRLALAKAYLHKKEGEKAKFHIDFVLKMVPNHAKALELLKTPSPPVGPACLPAGRGGGEGKKSFAWETLTMARLFAAQGHTEKAKSVYQAILKREPSNREALDALHSLSQEGA